ncbi:hypothetical protein GCK72_002709 [Caenorhabditis remanei]|uniref:Uncharacterized protein n=2 Tax=Caenorhabditis remanei TaxID=31234 RepID=A0A6A5HTJ4_CAERE|nr:hypothetical protein GCK72_002709 [Caenorhabditis remanei]KAF1770885.1 hypothetical protein GCK72_002709 [Caenorhabditis remanei]
MQNSKTTSSESSERQHNKKPDAFKLELSTTVFVVPTKGTLHIEVKNIAKKVQEVLITLESAIFTIQNFQKEVYPAQQVSMILNPMETKSFTISVRDHFPEPFTFEKNQLKNPEGELTISHCGTTKKTGKVELDVGENGLMILGVEKNEKLRWGMFSHNIMMDNATRELKEQKERYLRERKEFEDRKSGKSSKESGSEKEKDVFECCGISCVIA